MGHLPSVSTLQRSSKLRPLFIATSSPLRMWKYFSAAFLFFGFKLHDPFPKALDLRWKVCFVLLAFSLFAHTFPIGIFFQLISLFFPPLSLSLVQCTLEKRSTKSALLSTCPRPNDCNRLGKLFGYTSRKKKREKEPSKRQSGIAGILPISGRGRRRRRRHAGTFVSNRAKTPFYGLPIRLSIPVNEGSFWCFFFVAEEFGVLFEGRIKIPKRWTWHVAIRVSWDRL